MVAQVWGKCDGQDVSFARNEAGRWEAAVPASPTGLYVIELWARDEAGNVGYLARVKLAFDTSKLCFRVEILEVGADFSMEDVRALFQGRVLCSQVRDDPVGAGFVLEDTRAVFREPDLRGEALDDPVGADFVLDDVPGELVRCEVCGD